MGSVAFSSVEPSLSWISPLSLPNSYSMDGSWYTSSRWVVVRNEGSHMSSESILESAFYSWVDFLLFSLDNSEG